MIRLITLKIAALAAVLLYTENTVAHRTSAALTTVVWVDSEQAFEITHRLHLHDVQVALRNSISAPTTTIFSLEGQAELILYMTETFSLNDTSNLPISLSPIGAEVEGDYVYVYQEAKLETKPKGLSILDLTFFDIFFEQENQVNVEYNSHISTVIFNANQQDSLSVAFKD